MTITRSHFLRLGLAAIAAIAMTPAATFAQTKTSYVFATEGAFPPFNMTSPTGELKGFEIDMINEIGKRAGFDVKIIPQAWDGMIQGVIDGKYDGVIDSVSVTDKRREVIDFSLPYTTGGSTFFVAKDSGLELPGNGTSVDLADDAATQPAIADIAKVLAGKTVGVQVSTIQSTFLTKYLADKGVTVRTYPNGPDVYHDLLNGRIDAGMAAETNVAAFLEKNAAEAVKTGPSIKGGVMGTGSAVAIRKGNKDLQQKLDKGLKSTSDDGSLAELSKKWFGMVITPKL
ncbi:transporter substrate-binding domain-containing protein [Rhizobium sp. rho-1.1]|uniref:transporter substrate-binding domain-containing protein n=1 Tax=Rhizobium sp. rho-1.1 TaxID=2506429 RepID=UPI00116039DF|nr:transporter substrate-binding domain-containing protein [Rhizobium sp. rho-1.1]TQY08867.1 amino acid ABC transporter substrate-binding protein [Rhizobium sp. rho-1.1]